MQISPSSKSVYMEQLDGLRAIAVVAVFVAHWVSPRFHFGIPWGNLGVQLFFVISGFLITGILLDCRAETLPGGRNSVAVRFYLRRALRIFPAFYATLGIAWWAGAPALRESFGWHVTYLSNVYFFLRGSWNAEVSHFWSLAVEEQFYLAWPWLILFLSRRSLSKVLLGCLVAAPAFRIWGALSAQPFLHGVLPFASLDTLGIGALFAVLIRDAEGRLLADRLARLCVMFGLPGLALCRLASSIAPVVGALEQSFLAMVFAWAVFGASRSFSGVAGALLELSALRSLGRISYGLYLWHNFTPLALGYVATTWNPPAFLLHGVPRFGVLLGMTIGIASVSWFMLERPINRMKRYFPYTNDVSKHEREKVLPIATKAGLSGRTA